MSKKREICQVCAVVRDLEKSMERYWKILDVGPWDIYTFTPETLTEFTFHGQLVIEPFEFRLAVAMVGDIQYELVQPVKGPLIYSTFLEEKGEGFHHIKERINDDDMEETIKRYKQKGVDVIQSGRFDEDVFYYLNTEPVLGIILELGNCGKVRPSERRYPADSSD